MIRGEAEAAALNLLGFSHAIQSKAARPISVAGDLNAALGDQKQK